ncbi:MAG: hypothetical protein IPO66_12675 [Rhodanobacteraceae bacterium]|nr:hypothetical protein [Rhodanobacteraceae bacterium]
MLANSDRRRIEWFVYSTTAKADAVSARLRGHVEQWRILDGLGDEERARQIHADGVHVLIDLAGHSALNALAVFARRPAPVLQVSFSSASFATTGLTEIDYLLADAMSVPDSDRGLFTESIWHLPKTRLCFTVPDPAPDVAPPPSATNGFITFGSFQTLRKLNDECWLPGPKSSMATSTAACGCRTQNCRRKRGGRPFGNARRAPESRLRGWICMALNRAASTCSSMRRSTSCSTASRFRAGPRPARGCGWECRR